MNFSQTPPHRADLEQTILGAMLVDKTAYYLANEQQPLKPEDFYLHKHQVIYSCIESLAQSNRDIDLITIVSELQKQPLSIEPYELVDLTKRVASSANLASWIMELKQLSMRRELIKVSFEAHKKAFDMSQDALELISEAQAHTTNITDQLTGTAQSVDNILDLIHTRATQPSKSKGLAIPSNIIALDNIINGGIEKEDFIVIGGRPSQGKTALALNMALALLVQGKEIAFFSYEMTAEQLLRRLLSSYAQIPQNELKKGSMADEHKATYELGIQFLRDSQHLIHIYDCAGMEIEVLKAKSHALKAKAPNLACIFIDYAQLMATGQRIDDDNKKATYINNHLMYLKKAIKTPVVLLSQLRKSVGSSVPTSADLYGSQSTEANATKILLMYRPEHYKIDKFEDSEDAIGKGDVIVCKNRDGVLGVARLHFAGSITTWSDEQIEVYGVPEGMPF